MLVVLLHLRQRQAALRIAVLQRGTVHEVYLHWELRTLVAILLPVINILMPVVLLQLAVWPQLVLTVMVVLPLAIARGASLL